MAAHVGVKRVPMITRNHRPSSAKYATAFAKTASRPNRALIACIIVFVVMFLLNMIWPEAATIG